MRRDETIRDTTTVAGLAGLNPAFRTDELAARFPQLDWRITAGNSSPLTDGASAALIMSAERAAALKLTPRARFLSFAVTGSDPIFMLTGVIPATRKVLERASLTIDDMDAYEVNEAFASVPLAWQARPGRRSRTSSTRGAARSRSATRSAPPARGCSPPWSTTSSPAAGDTDCRPCARAAVWPTRQ